MPKIIGIEVAEKQREKPINQEAADKITANILSFASPDISSINNMRLVSKDWKRVIDKEFPIQLAHKTFPDLKLTMVKQLGGGGTNTTMLIKTLKDTLVGRYPGSHSSAFVNRAVESQNIKMTYKLGLSPEILFDDSKGILLTRYLNNPKTMSNETLKNATLLKKCVKALKQIHNSGIKFVNTIDVLQRNDRMIVILTDCRHTFPEDFKSIQSNIDNIKKLFTHFEIDKVPCHIDPSPSNFVESNGSIKLIDWEYSGNSDPVWDLLFLSMEAEFTPEQENQLLEFYYDQGDNAEARQRFILYKPVYHLWVYLWASVQLANNNLVFGSESLHQLADSGLHKFNESIKDAEFLKTYNEYLKYSKIKPKEIDRRQNNLMK